MVSQVGQTVSASTSAQLIRRRGWSSMLTTMEVTVKRRLGWRVAVLWLTGTVGAMAQGDVQLEIVGDGITDPQGGLLASPAYAELWRDGGNSTIDPPGSGDDTVVVGTVMEMITDGFFYGYFLAPSVDLTTSDMVFVRVYDETGNAYLDDQTLYSLATAAPPSPPMTLVFSMAGAADWVSTGTGTNALPTVELSGVSNGQTIRGVATVVATLSSMAGVDSVQIEIRLTGRDTWQSLSTFASGGAFRARVVGGRLTPGATYELRAVALVEGEEVESNVLTVRAAPRLFRRR